MSLKPFSQKEIIQMIQNRNHQPVFLIDTNNNDQIALAAGGNKQLLFIPKEDNFYLKEISVVASSTVDGKYTDILYAPDVSVMIKIDNENITTSAGNITAVLGSFNKQVKRNSPFVVGVDTVFELQFTNNTAATVYISAAFVGDYLRSYAKTGTTRQG